MYLQLVTWAKMDADLAHLEQLFANMILGRKIV
jgi:hypothetical protein